MGFKSSFAALSTAAVVISLTASPSESPAQASYNPAAPGRAVPANATHRIAILEGEVQAGHAFERPIGNGLKLLLEPIVSGWVLRVIPAQGARGPHDYAELATPPYQSVSPLLISTDFSFRAQDALAWNPRRFRFAADRASFAELSAAFDRYQAQARGGSGAPAQTRLEESRLATLVSRAPEAELTILDARLEQGTGNQAQSASLVAVHPNSSARQVDQPANGIATPLGRVKWLRFRVRLDLPPEFRANKGLRTERSGAP